MAQQQPVRELSPRPSEQQTQPNQPQPQYIPVPENQIILQMLSDIHRMLTDIHQVILKKP